MYGWKESPKAFAYERIARSTFMESATRMDCFGPTRRYCSSPGLSKSKPRREIAIVRRASAASQHKIRIRPPSDEQEHATIGAHDRLSCSDIARARSATVPTRSDSVPSMRGPVPATSALSHNPDRKATPLETANQRTRIPVVQRELARLNAGRRQGAKPARGAATEVGAGAASTGIGKPRGTPDAAPLIY